jgi:hypothetical protein
VILGCVRGFFLRGWEKDGKRCGRLIYREARMGWEWYFSSRGSKGRVGVARATEVFPMGCSSRGPGTLVDRQ